ncbi:Hypothetical protein IALB_1714 [Ignavibacterium album JCM 16511]|uniref:Uncharacterized protein n=1 Tax=Ignavibacterium album (strain DSM 19864 / JCM 16511 / NBRC 101810 / Mat9-16) TaxID=945713 RepID=I0AKB4_IGNAJ|nr:hypothetical protein [Ignavibacterium album]AFH49421.1 Hypothetical protein IALB_1714 [Ignavibacterium album JCM 16511]
MTIKNIELIKKLKQTLDLEVTYPPVLIAVSFFIFQSVDNSLPVPTILIIAAAKMAIPFIVYVLIKENKIGWIFSLLVFIVIPSVIIYFIIRESIFSKYFLLIPFLIFFFYCLLLNNSVRDWLAEAQAREEREEMKSESAKLKLDE